MFKCGKYEYGEHILFQLRHKQLEICKDAKSTQKIKAQTLYKYHTC